MRERGHRFALLMARTRIACGSLLPAAVDDCLRSSDARYPFRWCDEASVSRAAAWSGTVPRRRSCHATSATPRACTIGDAPFTSPTTSTLKRPRLQGRGNQKESGIWSGARSECRFGQRASKASAGRMSSISSSCGCRRVSTRLQGRSAGQPREAPRRVREHAGGLLLIGVDQDPATGAPILRRSAYICADSTRGSSKRVWRLSIQASCRTCGSLRIQPSWIWRRRRETHESPLAPMRSRTPHASTCGPANIRGRRTWPISSDWNA